MKDDHDEKFGVGAESSRARFSCFGGKLIRLLFSDSLFELILQVGLAIRLVLWLFTLLVDLHVILRLVVV